jgi:hypothetical protein
MASIEPFDSSKKYLDFNVVNVYKLDDINSKKHYNVFINYTDAEKDTLRFFKILNQYCIYYDKFNNIINEETRKSHCEENKYARISKFPFISMTNDTTNIRYSIITDETLHSQTKSQHITLDRVFLDPTFEKVKEIYATYSNNLDKLSDDDQIKFMSIISNFLNNARNYTTFDDMKIVNSINNKSSNEIAEYLINEDTYDSYVYRKTNGYNKLSNKVFNAPSSYSKSSDYFNYDENYELLSENDRDILNIINEFRLKKKELDDSYIHNGSADNSNFLNIKLGSNAENSHMLNHITSFMAKRLYINYNEFMLVKENDIDSDELITYYNDELYRLFDAKKMNEINSSKHNESINKHNEFKNAFWNKLKPKMD